MATASAQVPGPATGAPAGPGIRLSGVTCATFRERREPLHSGNLEVARETLQAYGRAGRPCRRCGTLVRAFGQGDANRRAYWCPVCQAGGREPRPGPGRSAPSGITGSPGGRR